MMLRSGRLDRGRTEMKFMEKRGWLLAHATLLALAVVLASASAAQAEPSGRPATAPALPPLPHGLAPHFGMGLSNSDPATLFPGMPLDYRYQYLAGGVNTGNGWASWNSPAGQFAVNYIDESRARGLTPVFVYYQIAESSAGWDAYANLQNPAIMRACFNDFRLLMQKTAAAGGSGRVLVNIEPDLNGTMQQRASAVDDDASRQPSSVASSGQPDVQGYPNTFRGYYQALAHIRDVYAPNTLLGLDVSHWGASDDVTSALRRNPSFDWAAHATRTANFLNSLGPGFEILFYSPLDRDSAYYQLTAASNRWWDDRDVTQPTFATMGAWLGRVVSLTGRRAILWQVPVGNRVYRTENNTPGHWQDNRAEYFLNDATGRAHLTEWANDGVVGIMWGAGEGSQTHYFDNARDGVTNPSPINGNNQVSTYADDDGGYLRIHLGSYYAAGAIALPASSPGSCSPPFPDVGPAGAYYAGLRFLYCNGAIGGYPDGSFLPRNSTSRGQLMKIIVKAYGWPTNISGAPHFSDVPSGSPYFAYIETAFNRGIVSGYADHTFRPQAGASRGQVAKVVVRASGLPLVTPQSPTFADVRPNSTYFAYVETALRHGLLSGYPDGLFRPNNDASRAQTCKITYSGLTQH